MLYNRIIRSLVDVKQAIKEKFGDDGVKERGGRDYSSGPDGFDRIRYEVDRRKCQSHGCQSRGCQT
jgi:hypothetical protein